MQYEVRKKQEFRPLDVVVRVGTPEEALALATLLKQSTVHGVDNISGTARGHQIRQHAQSVLGTEKLHQLAARLRDAAVEEVA